MIFKIKQLQIKNHNQTLVDISSFVVQSSLALVGQSGSGKSLTIKAILNLLPSNLQANFQYESDFALNVANIGFVPQNPFTSLSNLTKVYKQFFRPDGKLYDHNSIDKMLQLVKLDPNIKYKLPKHLSGGQLQRIIIAIALSNNPKLLLLDEPTTALDEQTKQDILKLILSLHKQLGFLMIFVTHDISSIEQLCKDIVVLYQGKICEKGNLQQVLQNPTNQYTKQLIQSNFKYREFRK